MILTPRGNSCECVIEPVRCSPSDCGSKWFSTERLVATAAIRCARRWRKRVSSAGQSYPVPNAPNQLEPTGNGAWVMSLSHREFWMLQPDQEAVASAMQGEALAAEVRPLYCQHSHAWLQLAGAPRAEVMATLCGVDLSQAAFPEGSVVQTQVARVTSIIAHHAEGPELASFRCLSISRWRSIYGRPWRTPSRGLIAQPESLINPDYRNDS